MPDSAEMESFIRSYYYMIVNRQLFDNHLHLPDGLKARADAWKGQWVVFDPLADNEGFMIIGNDRTALLHEAYDHVQSML